MNPQQQGQYLARLPKPFSQVQIQQLSPAALAYLGDAVYELYVRTCHLLPPKRIQIFHQQVVARVRAEAQARCLQYLQPLLTATEIEIIRQGRNAASGRSRRIDPSTYQQATSFEALIGYLYLTNPQRLDQLLQSLKLEAVGQNEGLL